MGEARPQNATGVKSSAGSAESARASFHHIIIIIFGIDYPSTKKNKKKTYKSICHWDFNVHGLKLSVSDETIGGSTSSSAQLVMCE